MSKTLTYSMCGFLKEINSRCWDWILNWQRPGSPCPTAVETLDCASALCLSHRPQLITHKTLTLKMGTHSILHTLHLLPGRATPVMEGCLSSFSHALEHWPHSTTARARLQQLFLAWPTASNLEHLVSFGTTLALSKWIAKADHGYKYMVNGLEHTSMFKKQCSPKLA